jgi:hypothetical protein
MAKKPTSKKSTDPKAAAEKSMREYEQSGGVMKQAEAEKAAQTENPVIELTWDNVIAALKTKVEAREFADTEAFHSHVKAWLGQAWFNKLNLTGTLKTLWDENAEPKAADPGTPMMSYEEMLRALQIRGEAGFDDSIRTEDDFKKYAHGFLGPVFYNMAFASGALDEIWDKATFPGEPEPTGNDLADALAALGKKAEPAKGAKKKPAPAEKEAHDVYFSFSLLGVTVIHQGQPLMAHNTYEVASQAAIVHKLTGQLGHGRAWDGEASEWVDLTAMVERHAQRKVPTPVDVSWPFEQDAAEGRATIEDETHLSVEPEPAPRPEPETFEARLARIEAELAETRRELRELMARWADPAPVAKPARPAPVRARTGTTAVQDVAAVFDREPEGRFTAEELMVKANRTSKSTVQLACKSLGLKKDADGKYYRQ